MTRPRRATNRRTGLTLIEVAVSTLLLAGFVGVPAMLLLTASRSYETEVSSARATEALRRGLDEISTRLVQSSAGSVSLMAVAPDNEDTIDYQRAVDYQAGATVWGPWERIEFEYGPNEPDDGVDNDGDGLVDEGRVVWLESPGAPGERRVTLVNNVPESWPGEVPGNFLDDNGNGLEDERGLAFDLWGDRVSISLTVQLPRPDGPPLTRSLQRTVCFLNPD